MEKTRTRSISVDPIGIDIMTFAKLAKKNNGNSSVADLQNVSGSLKFTMLSQNIVLLPFFGMRFQVILWWKRHKMSP
jgi:ABC-type uncharacterized transport system involved in gliding motility auxiliary subunit